MDYVINFFLLKSDVKFTSVLVLKLQKQLNACFINSAIKNIMRCMKVFSVIFEAVCNTIHK